MVARLRGAAASTGPTTSATDTTAAPRATYPDGVLTAEFFAAPRESRTKAFLSRLP